MHLSRESALAKIRAARLYGIVDLGYCEPGNVATVAGHLIAGGAGIIQLRAKGHGKAEIERLSREVCTVCNQHSIPFIVNDYPDIALAVAADGVHIGQDDGSLASARGIVGSQMIVGRSTHSVDQARGAMDEGFDYAGFGPLFPTPTKKGRPGIGLENVKTVEAEVSPTMPLFCIGGIVPGNLETVIEAGAERIVVVSALLTATNIAEATQAVVARLK